MTEKWEGEEKSCIDTDWENLIWLKIQSKEWLVATGGRGPHTGHILPDLQPIHYATVSI